MLDRVLGTAMGLEMVRDLASVKGSDKVLGLEKAKASVKGLGSVIHLDSAMVKRLDSGKDLVTMKLMDLARDLPTVMVTVTGLGWQPVRFQYPND